MPGVPLRPLPEVEFTSKQPAATPSVFHGEHRCDGCRAGLDANESHRNAQFYLRSWPERDPSRGGPIFFYGFDESIFSSSSSHCVRPNHRADDCRRYEDCDENNHRDAGPEQLIGNHLQQTPGQDAALLPAVGLPRAPAT